MASGAITVSPRVRVRDLERMVRARLAEHGEVILTSERRHLIRQLAKRLALDSDVGTVLDKVGDRSEYLIVHPSGTAPRLYWRPGDDRPPTLEVA